MIIIVNKTYDNNYCLIYDGNKLDFYDAKFEELIDIVGKSICIINYPIIGLSLDLRGEILRLYKKNKYVYIGYKYVILYDKGMVTEYKLVKALYIQVTNVDLLGYDFVIDGSELVPYLVFNNSKVNFIKAMDLNNYLKYCKNVK